MTLSRHGIALEALKRPSAFRTPMPKAAPHMKIMYGSKVFTSLIVNSVRPDSSNSRRHATTLSSPRKTRATIAVSITSDIVITARASRSARSCAPLSISRLKTGTNAAVSAPSPKSFLAMFGMAKASVKALCSTPAPIILDWSISRTIPKTLDSAVNAPTVRVLRRIFAILESSGATVNPA